MLVTSLFDNVYVMPPRLYSQVAISTTCGAKPSVLSVLLVLLTMPDSVAAVKREEAAATMAKMTILTAVGLMIYSMICTAMLTAQDTSIEVKRLTSGVTYYSSQGLGERRLSRKGLGLFNPNTATTATTGSTASGTAAPATSVPETPRSRLASIATSRPMAFSPDLYAVIMSKAPQDMRSAASTTLQDIPSSRSAGPSKSDSADTTSTPRIGRRQGRQTVDFISTNNEDDGNETETRAEFEESVDRQQSWSALSRPSSQFPVIPGEDDLGEVSSGVDEGGGVSRSSSLSYCGPSTNIAAELSNLPLTRDSRDAIVNSLVHRFGKSSERKLQQLIDDELAVRKAYPLVGQSKGVGDDSFSSASKYLKALIPTLSGGSEDPYETYKGKSGGHSYDRKSSRRNSSLFPITTLFDPIPPLFEEPEDEQTGETPIQSPTSNRRLEEGELSSPRSVLDDDGHMSGSEGDQEDNAPLDSAALARRQRRCQRPRSRSHSLNRQASTPNRDDRARGERYLTDELANIPADTNTALTPSHHQPQGASMDAEASPVLAKSNRKVSPSLQMLQERAFVSSAFGKSPQHDTLTNPSSDTASIASTNDAATSSRTRSSTFPMPVNERPISASSSTNSSRVSNPTTGATFGLGSHLALSPQVGRVAAAKKNFEQYQSEVLGHSGGSSRSSRSSSLVSGNSFVPTNYSSSGNPKENHGSASTKLPPSPLFKKSTAALSNVSGRTNTSSSIATKVILTQLTTDGTEGLERPNTSSSTRALLANTNASLLPPNSPSSNSSSNHSSSANSSTPSIFTSSNSTVMSPNHSNSPTHSNLSLPPHHGTPKDRARRRQSNTLKAIQNSGLVRGRLQQLFTASTPMVASPRAPNAANSSGHEHRNKSTVDYSQRGRRYLEQELGMDLSPSLPRSTLSLQKQRDIPPVPTTTTDMDRQANVSSSPILTRTTVDLNELLEASARENHGDDSMQSPDTTHSAHTASLPSRERMGFTSEQLRAMFNEDQKIPLFQNWLDKLCRH